MINICARWLLCISMFPRSMHDIEVMRLFFLKIVHTNSHGGETSEMTVYPLFIGIAIMSNNSSLFLS